MKLQRLVASVQAEMAEAQAAADQCAPSANALAQHSLVPHKARYKLSAALRPHLTSAFAPPHLSVQNGGAQAGATV